MHPLAVIMISPGLTDAEWRLGMSKAMDLAGQSYPLSLSVSAGVTVNQTQRRDASVLLKEKKLLAASHVAILTDSQLVMGAVTAFGWLTGGSMGLKGFRIRELDDALAWLARRQTFNTLEARRMVLRLAEGMAANPFG